MLQFEQRTVQPMQTTINNSVQVMHWLSRSTHLKGRRDDARIRAKSLQQFGQPNYAFFSFFCWVCGLGLVACAVTVVVFVSDARLLLQPRCAAV
jgi:hypothetical protein